MACPFFVPTEPSRELAFQHPRRLPLGTSWRGLCSAPGHEQEILTSIELESCNLGYAHACPRLPRKRLADAVRFAIAEDCGKKLRLAYVLEAGHLPVAHGFLEYDLVEKAWILPNPHPALQPLAQSFIESYLEGKSNPS